MDRSKIILSILIIASVILNVRLFVVFNNAHDDFVISMANTLNLESNALESLVESDLEKAKLTLARSIENKAAYISICIVEQCVSKSALAKINTKP